MSDTTKHETKLLLLSLVHTDSKNIDTASQKSLRCALCSNAHLGLRRNIPFGIMMQQTKCCLGLTCRTSMTSSSSCLVACRLAAGAGTGALAGRFALPGLLPAQTQPTALPANVLQLLFSLVFLCVYLCVSPNQRLNLISSSAMLSRVRLVC